MKFATGFAAAVAACMSLGVVSPAIAQYRGPQPYGATLPPFEVITIIRSMGFDPISRPVLRGPVYVIQALDEEAIPVRVLVDAYRGNVVRVTESRPAASVYAGLPPEAGFGPRRPPPETVPPGAVYRPYEENLSPPPTVQAPSPPKPKVAARTPLPRPAPPQSKAATTPPPVASTNAAIPDTKKIPGKSIPAPVASNKSTTTADPVVTGSTATSPEQGKSELSAPAIPETKPAVAVPPVAPLE